MTVDLRPEVQVFAELMEAKLRRHDDRPGWKFDSGASLFSRLREEAGKLAAELLGGNPSKIASAAADVANFAMMVADVCGGLDLRSAPTPTVWQWSRSDSGNTRLLHADGKLRGIVNTEAGWWVAYAADGEPIGSGVANNADTAQSAVDAFLRQEPRQQRIDDMLGAVCEWATAKRASDGAFAKVSQFGLPDVRQEFNTAQERLVTAEKALFTLADEGAPGVKPETVGPANTDSSTSETDK